MHGDAVGGAEWFVSTDRTDAGGSTLRVTKMTDYLGAMPAFDCFALPVTPYQAPTIVLRADGCERQADGARAAAHAH